MLKTYILSIIPGVLNVKRTRDPEFLINLQDDNYHCKEQVLGSLMYFLSYSVYFSLLRSRTHLGRGRLKYSLKISLQFLEPENNLTLAKIKAEMEAAGWRVLWG